MKINLFGLGKNEKWQEVENALYDIWCMHQSDIMLPRFMDADFKAAYNRIKKKYTYKELEAKLDL